MAAIRRDAHSTTLPRPVAVRSFPTAEKLGAAATHRGRLAAMIAVFRKDKEKLTRELDPREETQETRVCT